MTSRDYYSSALVDVIKQNLCFGVVDNLRSAGYTEVGITKNPKQIIFQPDLKTTVVIWGDNSKTVVKCAEGEEFIPEVGFAMALVKRNYPNRSDFLRMIKEAYYQPTRKTKKESK